MSVAFPFAGRVRRVGCISHNAYWRLKARCKRNGKPCLFVKSAGVSSFGRAVDDAGRQEPQLAVAGQTAIE